MTRARRRLGAAARRTVAKHSFRRNVDEILAIYREILARRDGLPRGYRVFSARVPASDFSGLRRSILAETATRIAASPVESVFEGVEP